MESTIGFLKHLAADLESVVRHLNASFYEDDDTTSENDRETIEKYIAKLEEGPRYLVYDTLIETLTDILTYFDSFYSAEKECRFKYLEGIKIKVDDALILIDDFLIELN